MSNFLTWEPNEGIGPIRFGGDINHYIELLKLVIDPDDAPDKTGWIQYQIPGKEVFIDAEADKVESVLCYKEFFFKNQNLIGMKVIDLDIVLNCHADEIGDSILYDDGDLQTPREYFSLGLQVWSSDNVVVSISCCTYADECDLT
ncbi:MAG: hypothetical protein ACI8WB_004947 [Phenylobacterium sp.]|jgi:hypothetical protein